MTASFYLLHVSGFLLLTLPVTLFLFLPFDEAYLRVRPRALSGALIGFNLLCAVFYPFFAAGQLFDFYLDAAILLLIAASCMLIRDTLTRKASALFVAVLCLKVQIMLALALSAAKAFGAESEAWSAFTFDVPTVLLFLLGAALLVPATVLFENRVLKPYLRMVSARSMWVHILLLIFANIGCFLLPMFFVGFFISLGTGPAWCVLFGLLPFVIMLAALYASTFRASLVRAQEAENRLQTELLRENSIHLQREMEHSRDLYHDLRQLLRQLNAMSEREGMAELKPYIEKIVSLTERSNKNFCENKCLNALLQYYAGCAAEKGIPISISADCGNVSVEDTDLTLLAANVLENAITGADEYRSRTGEEPSIAVIVGSVNNYLMLQSINSCFGARYAPGIPEEDRSRFLPMTAFQSTHGNGGRGLKRVQLIVDKYHGRANYQCDEKKMIWTARISLMVRRENP